MAMKSDYKVTSNSGIKVEGDIGDVQIIEEVSDDDTGHDTQTNLRTSSALPNSSLGLLPSTSPVIGTVSVSNSENVHFGNNTFFNGPVTIIQSKFGVENASYTNTEDKNLEKEGDKITPECVATIKKHDVLTLQKLIIFVICIILVGGVVAIILTTMNKTDDLSSSTTPTYFNDTYSVEPLLRTPDHLRIVSRTDWLAQPIEGPLDKIKQPVPWVVITHTATESCYIQSHCILVVRLIQSFHIESRKWYDIGYNFLVGGDGSVYYGRGWDYIGAHTKGYNRYSIAIAFIGTFTKNSPPQQQIDACKKLIKQGVELGVLRNDYKLFGHRQLIPTASPGDKLFDIIKEWPHFVSNLTDVGNLIPKGY